jgi:hypothetical protein
MMTSMSVFHSLGKQTECAKVVSDFKKLKQLDKTEALILHSFMKFVSMFEVHIHIMPFDDLIIALNVR